MKKINFNIVMMAIITIMGMDLIDTTVMNNILPKISESLDTTPEHLKMGISIYMIVMGMFLPLSSWMAEKIGYKYTLIFAASGFGFFSLLSGLAMTDTQLFTYRAIQGLFAAFSAPVAGLAYLKFSENMLEGTASLSNYTLIMAIAGQVLGGIFASISAESWRLAFLMQVPFACFAVIAIYKHFPDEKHNNQNKKIDFVGLTLLGLSISILFILSEILLKDVSMTIKIVLTIFIIIFISLYAFSYNKIKNPIIDLSIFLNKDFRVSFMSNFFCRLTTYWVFFAWPVVLYHLSHLNTIYISIMSVSLMLGTIVSKSITKKLVYIYGYKICMILGLVGISVVMLISIIFDIHYSYITFCTVAMAYGFVLGMYQTSSNAVMYSVIDHEKLDSVNTIKNSGNMISSAFALTIFTLVYDIYHNFGMYHHWLQIFEQAYFCVVATSAVVQLIMVVWIALRMDNLREKA
ncbi:MFS transporter [Francisella hispaniensis]|uniref:MFS transporter n=1 Tax=Francisella hispaniensis TaxID=622488 RepID=UPI001906C5C1|nr:MFS transporter [Francisella hispaniensis]MBK2356950.1 MFS transporter [Francisella hispaniensis]